LRKGVTGITLGWCGFEPLHSYIGQPDIFGHPLRVTQTNILDALAASAVFVMGEGAEQTPLALIEDLPQIRFLSDPPSQEQEQSLHIPLEEDIYAPLLKDIPWIWNKSKEKCST
jgi:F420-0:gamma-glutamyl ligase